MLSRDARIRPGNTDPRRHRDGALSSAVFAFKNNLRWTPNLRAHFDWAVFARWHLSLFRAYEIIFNFVRPLGSRSLLVAYMRRAERADLTIS